MLWASRTTPHSSTGGTSFSFVYEIEAIILAKIAIPTLQIAHGEQSLVSGKENRDQASVQLSIY